jgi:hypothetical protein
LSPGNQAAVLADILWNLRTWPLEITLWPSDNSHRKDIVIDPRINAGLLYGHEALTALPANERTQVREL